jgi:HSP20 family protein
MGNLFETFNSLLSLQNALENAMGADYYPSHTFFRGGSPTINLFQKGDDYIVTAEVPGVRKEDLSIEVKGDLVRIAGERKPDFTPQEVSVHRMEREYVKFDRTIKVPVAIDPEKVTASCEDGILTLTLGQREESRARRISITDGRH